MAAPEPLPVESFRQILVLTGAGVSAASGLHTYRGPRGLWRTQPERKALVHRDRLAAGPEAVWGHFGRLRARVLAVRPNPAHRALAALERRVTPATRVTLVTQNIDGLHARAGSAAPLELHGSVLRTRCLDPGCAPAYEDRVPHAGAGPPCPGCGGPTRPDVVLFGEGIPPARRQAAWAAAAGCDLFLAVGTSGLVGSARRLLAGAREAGAHTVCVDPAHEPGPRWDFERVVRAPAEAALEALLDLG